MAELHRYVDENGNVFSMTRDDAQAAGLKPYVEQRYVDDQGNVVYTNPAEAAKRGLTPAPEEAGAQPAEKARGAPANKDR